MSGERVLEPDFVSLHPQIIYALQGIPLIGDAYELGGAYPRVFGKKAFNIAVNARSHASAILALAHNLKLQRQAAAKLLNAIMKKHQAVSNVFCSDAGVSLMKIDSDITLTVIQQCHGSGIPVLPVHNSFVVPARHADKTAEIMIASFASRFPKSSPCRIRINCPAVSQMEEEAA